MSSMPGSVWCTTSLACTGMSNSHAGLEVHMLVTGFSSQRWSLRTHCCPPIQTHLSVEILVKQWNKKNWGFFRPTHLDHYHYGRPQKMLWNFCLETNRTLIIFSYSSLGFIQISYLKDNNSKGGSSEDFSFWHCKNSICLNAIKQSNETTYNRYFVLATLNHNVTLKTVWCSECGPIEDSFSFIYIPNVCPVLSMVSSVSTVIKDIKIAKKTKFAQ